MRLRIIESISKMQAIARPTCLYCRIPRLERVCPFRVATTGATRVGSTKLIWTGSVEMSPRVPQDQREIHPNITGDDEERSDRHKSYKNLVELIKSNET